MKIETALIAEMQNEGGKELDGESNSEPKP
jgi:hypothetical protein